MALVHQANGLLTGMTTAKGQTYAFAYDAATGYLVDDADPRAEARALARTTLAPDATRLFGHDVGQVTALGRTTGYRPSACATAIGWRLRPRRTAPRP